jgi:tetratricopeptide (TPR) repeat protein
MEQQQRERTSFSTHDSNTVRTHERRSRYALREERTSSRRSIHRLLDMSSQEGLELTTMVAFLRNPTIARMVARGNHRFHVNSLEEDNVTISSDAYFASSEITQRPRNLTEAYHAGRMIPQELYHEEEDEGEEEEEEEEGEGEEEEEEEEGEWVEDGETTMMNEALITINEHEKHTILDDATPLPRNIVMLQPPPPPALIHDPYANVSIKEFYGDEARCNPRLNMALYYLELAERDVGQDQIPRAIKHYRMSIKYFATAEAHTYLGWMYSRQGSYRRAIKECHKAIACDDTFGNPYNDIGFYLLIMNYLREGISWFERAKRAARATNRIAPYVNLAGIYRRLGMPEKALVECHEALRYDPSNRFLRDRRKELIQELGEHEAAIAILKGSCWDLAGR